MAPVGGASKFKCPSSGLPIEGKEGEGTGLALFKEDRGAPAM